MTSKVLTCSHFEQSFLYEISEKGSNHYHYMQGYISNDIEDGQKTSSNYNEYMLKK